ncbi:uncharacterized protein (TIGR02246 family) [Lipingzhangella halophila]|uniref:Uncharacterized protein (TIGR02246 family) n=1 Tax=Lipingzhangella halophila TaxID=1783352 RepID=A0A7W7RDP5_9ACTN|nr:SgcJ/EcaC family oxidoreductase [Lipingzhangella halophila]MBB4929915.1 uncharacterized protein (TIGR02246 family) [Lipingzhangella halophila]
MPFTSSHASASDTTRQPRRRRWVLWSGLGAVGAISVAAVSGYLWLTATSDVQVTGETDCEEAPITGVPDGMDAEEAQQGICHSIEALSEAWAVGDADAYGTSFTEDATYTAFAGTYYDGRTDIVEGHRALFDGVLSGTKLSDSFLGIRLLGPDTAIVTTRGDTYEDEPPDTPSKVQTYTLQRQPDDGWLIASFQNTQRKPLMERVQYLVNPDSRPAAER